MSVVVEIRSGVLVRRSVFEDVSSGQGDENQAVVQSGQRGEWEEGKKGETYLTTVETNANHPTML